MASQLSHLLQGTFQTLDTTSSSPILILNKNQSEEAFKLTYT